MGPPSQVAGAASAASGAAGILGFFGNLSAGIAQSNMYEYQAGMADVNAKNAAENRDYALTAGEQKAGQAGMATRFKLGQSKVRMAAGNMSVTSGSAADTLDSINAIGAMEAATIRNNAARVAYGHSVEEANARNQSTLYNYAANNALVSGAIGATGSLIAGSTSVSAKWLQGGPTFGK